MDQSTEPGLKSYWVVLLDQSCLSLADFRKPKRDIVHIAINVLEEMQNTNVFDRTSSLLMAKINHWPVPPMGHLQNLLMV